MTRHQQAEDFTKIESHAAAVALGYFAHNFIKTYLTLRVPPADGGRRTKSALGGGGPGFAAGRLRLEERRAA